MKLDKKVYQFKNISSFKNIVHGISTKAFGTMKNEDGTINRENLNKFLQFLGVSGTAICMGQVHGNTVDIADGVERLRIDNTDGLITSRTNLPLCVVTADCLPIMLFDPIKNVIGIAHGGRKGIAVGIIKNIIQRMKDKFGIDPASILVGVGPGIEKKCYEVDGALVDIRMNALKELQAAGIKESHIEHIAICTKCHREDFYSYRGGDKNNRFASVISLV